MKVYLTMHTPEQDISTNAKICYGNKSDKDITSTLVFGHGHLAALRFSYATVNVTGISVACQNQIVRSKHLDFMVQSKRYVSASKGEFAFIMPEGLEDELAAVMQDHFDRTLDLYNILVARGVKKEDARAILPMNTSTEMNITGSLQGWWDFFKLRMNSHAQLEVRNVANEIFTQLSEVYPQVFNARSKAIFEN